MAVMIPLFVVDDWLQSSVKSPIFLAMWLIAYTFSFDFYSIAMHARFGQTLGKMVTGVKVLDLSESKLSLRQALLRDSVSVVFTVLILVGEVPKTLSGVDRYGSSELDIWDQFQMYTSLGWFAAELLTMLTNRKRRALHDFIARSVVVRVRPLGASIRHDEAAG